MDSNFKVYRSSAGSGKTYTLALNFICLAISGNENWHQNYYKRILAITFTNKAAAEMKERVLEYLDLLGRGEDTDNILSWIVSETSLDASEIFLRAKLIHNHILHNYSDLSISTIDKFTYRIVRSFAIDLGLSWNFELEMDNEKIIQPVVALLLSRVSRKGGVLSDILIHFTLTKIDDGKSSDIERDLQEFSKELFKEGSLSYIEDNVVSIKDCLKVRKSIQSRKENSRREIIKLRDLVCKYFQEHNLNKEHFISGTFYNYFTKKLFDEDDSKWIPTNTLNENVKNNIWYAQGKSQDVKDKVDACQNELLDFYYKLIGFIEEYNSCKAVIKNVYSLALLNELKNQMSLYKIEQNIEQISTFNTKIHNMVVQHSASFIYERIGSRYNHYLIDEFQDTSLLQWQNILPLITDSLDYGKSLVVGDGKQSIYRWRGGEVEQFSKLPVIYNGDSLPFKKEWEYKTSQHYKEYSLGTNYRSCREIVNFNNQFFNSIKLLLSEDLQEIYKAPPQECFNSDIEGYVHLELFSDKEDDFKANILARLYTEIINLVRDNNYSFRDIAILCNSKKRVALVAEYLSSFDIPVISNEGLLLNNSDKVHLIISCLRYLNNNKDDLSKASIVYYLYESIDSTDYFHKLNLEIKSQEGFHRILNSYGVYLNEYKLLEKPLYQMVESLIISFNINEGIYLQFFLDLILSYSFKEGNNLSSFLNWWDSSNHKHSIVNPEGVDAVNIMTIHKSKGLAFNIVIIPFNWEDTKNSNDIWVDTTKSFSQDISVGLISVNNSLKYSFFSDRVRRESDLSLLDKINKLYVAMTRAKERLYIFSKSFPAKPSKDFTRKGRLNSFLYSFSDNYPIIIGDENNKCLEKKKESSSSFLVSDKKKLDWREVISLRHSANEIWDTNSSTFQRDWGKLLHRVLSKIVYLDQRNDILDSMYRKKEFSNEEYNKLKKTIDSLFSDPSISYYFSNNWHVRNEKEILTSTGRIYIPDRLLIDKDSGEMVVIDYKTGSKNEEYIIQISEYARILEQMGYRVVKKILLYTQEKNKLQFV